MTYTQAMTFSDLVTEVRALRFNANDTTRIQRWINDAYAELWNADEWIFKYARVTNITVTAGSTAVSNLPADFGIALGFWRADGTPLRYLPPRDFTNLYAGATDTGGPAFFTAIDQALIVGPVSSESSSGYTLVYEKRLTALVNDSDVPAIPAEHHFHLVTGAMSRGLRLFNDFTWEFQEQAWQAGIQAMRREWLVDQRGEVGTWGRDTVEVIPTFWGA